MSIYEDTNPRELKHLLGQIDQREAALPDFQRDFVWDPNATQELIVSIASNFPAGSLLRIRNTRQLFAYREFQGAPAINGAKTTYLVLDGQQRLTSLFQAFFGVGDHRYYLDLTKLIGGAEFEDAIFHLRANHKRAVLLESFEAQCDELILPLGTLKGGSGGFAKWAKAVLKRTQATLSEEALDQLDKALDDISDRWIQTIDDYKFPVVTLSDETDAEAVCTIFETLNRTGVKLSPFELLTARFWPHNVNLRELWAKSQHDHPIIAEFTVDPYYLLQAVALLSTKPPACKRSDVLNLTADQIAAHWDSCVAGLADGLQLLRTRCGVLTKDWLPIAPLLVTLAAARAQTMEVTGPKQGFIRDGLVRWFWCSSLGGKYESGPNSQATRDLSELLSWFKGGDPPDTIKSFRFDPRELRQTTFRQRSLYRALMCIVLLGQPRDFHTGEVLTPDRLRAGYVDDHHIFPQAWLEQPSHEALPARLRDSILNRTLIDRFTNERIGKKAPSVYLAPIRQELGPEGFSEVLRSHLLPDDDVSPLLTDNFAAFVDWRQEAFWWRIKNLAELREASELIEETQNVLG